MPLLLTASKSQKTGAKQYLAAQIARGRTDASKRAPTSPNATPDQMSGNRAIQEFRSDSPTQSRHNPVQARSHKPTSTAFSKRTRCGEEKPFRPMLIREPAAK